MSDVSIEEVGDSELESLQREVRIVNDNYELLQENLASVMLALDDAGQRTLGDGWDENELKLNTVKAAAKSTRSLLALNPLAKRGVGVRSAYIWGGGVEFTGLDLESKFYTKPVNQKYLFSPQAWGEMEACLSTDGNFCLLVDKGGVLSPKPDRAKVMRVPLTQITGTISDPDNLEDIWFYKREWSTQDDLSQAVNGTVTPKVRYYPSIDYDLSNGRPRRILDVPVDWTSAIAHSPVNKQVGWRWGIGDLATSIFWLGAHKSYLEMCAQLVRAYSRFAFKATQPTRAGVNATATKVAAQPSIDPQTGRPNDVGGTAVLGAGANLQAIGRTGGSVDFKAGTPLAGYVAAGLEIPLTELLADASDANRSSAETLNGATNKAMKARQELHKRFFERIFEFVGIKGVKVNFPPIEQEPMYRVLQAIASAMPMNILSDKEVRKLVISAFDIEGSETPPTEEELGLLLAANHSAAKQAAETAKLAAENPAPVANEDGEAPTKVKKARSAAPSYGDNSARAQQGDHKLNKNNK